MQQTLSKRVYDFSVQLFRDFYNNQGYLLSGALAYYILLSLIPLLILTLILLSNTIDEATLLNIVTSQLGELFPGAMGSVMQQVQNAYASKTVFGYFGIISLFIFSSLIFRTLQKIMFTIFPYKQPKRISLRRIVVPYLFILIFFSITFVFTLLSTSIDTISTTEWMIFSFNLDISPVISNLTQYLILFADFILLVLFYKIFPQVKIKWKYAVYAAFFVGSLWLATKQVLIYFFQHFSSVSIIYGALSSFFILLISLEFFSVLLLFGAQYIATYQQYKQKRQTQL